MRNMEYLVTVDEVDWNRVIVGYNLLGVSF